MSDRRSLGRLAREPLYNTRAVVQTTGIPADTIRAWERRHGVPRPFRTPSNQRLYSERDIGVIGWLRDRTAEGMTISQAIRRLKLESPELFADAPQPMQPRQLPQREPHGDPQPERLRMRLLDAFTVFDMAEAERVLDEAFAQFSVEAVCSWVIESALVELGERWRRGELGVAVEHLASRIVSQRLAAILAMVLPVTGRGTIVAACPPGEEHDVGLLVLAIFLARRGWRVVTLGANVPAQDIVGAVLAIRPDLVCLSASSTTMAGQALAVARLVRSRIDTPPPVVVGGTGFAGHDRSQLEIGVLCLAGRAGEIADRVGEQLQRG